MRPSRAMMAVGMGPLLAAASVATVVFVDETTPAIKPDAKPKNLDEPRGELTNIMTVEDAMKSTGTTSPSAALRNKKHFSPGTNWGYLPHVGAKQRAKALKRMVRGKAP